MTSALRKGGRVWRKSIHWFGELHGSCTVDQYRMRTMKVRGECKIPKILRISFIECTLKYFPSTSSLASRTYPLIVQVSGFLLVGEGTASRVWFSSSPPSPVSPNSMSLLRGTHWMSAEAKEVS